MAIWDGLEEFLAVAEAGSFTNAAKRLRVSPSHVSRKVAALEDRLGLKLFARSTRIVRLTDEGADYYERASEVVDDLREANLSVIGPQADLSGRIRVSAAGPYAESLIAPALAEFARTHSGLSVEIDFNARIVNLIEEGFDFAIRYGEMKDNGLIARRLSSRKMICLASRDYIEAHGAPKHPADLSQHNCLITNSDRWLFQDKTSGKPFAVRVTGSWQANNLYAIRAGLTKDLGIAYATEMFLKPHVNDPGYVRLLEGYEDTSRASWIVYPEKRHMPIRVRRAMDFLIEHLGSQSIECVR